MSHRPWGATFLYGQSQGLSLAVTQTMAVNTLVRAQSTYLFNARHRSRMDIRVTLVDTG